MNLKYSDFCTALLIVIFLSLKAPTIILKNDYHLPVKFIFTAGTQNYNFIIAPKTAQGFNFKECWNTLAFECGKYPNQSITPEQLLGILDKKSVCNNHTIWINEKGNYGFTAGMTYKEVGILSCAYRPPPP